MTDHPNRRDSTSFALTGTVVDVVARRTFDAEVVVRSGRIVEISPVARSAGQFILPGFVDAHVHVESSLLTPHEFARMAVAHGTVATVSDPHEIANVLGAPGIAFMRDNAVAAPCLINFGVPSCVPATGFETAGATIDSAQVAALLQEPDLGYLAEMMNFPAVVAGDAEVLAKIAAAVRLGKPVDGHAPGLTGDALRRYRSAGITTDHECTTRAEAEEKLSCGMKILIREGSAAQNFAALHGILDTHSDQVMLCTDDAHPDVLRRGHINVLAARALAAGHRLFDVLTAACVNPVRHYGLPIGLLQRGDWADFVVCPDLVSFAPHQVFRRGKLVATNGKCTVGEATASTPNVCAARPLSSNDLVVSRRGDHLRVITVQDRTLLTGESIVALADLVSGPVPSAHNREVQSSPERDILKVVVVNRYHPAPPSVAFVHGFALAGGALASSVAHDSHNIVAVGTNDADLVGAVNLVIEHGGGLAAVRGDVREILPLPVAGLMSAQVGPSVADAYENIDRLVKEWGTRLSAPFMTLSFVPLLVIPALKLSDRGLFDSRSFSFVPVLF